MNKRKLFLWCLYTFANSIVFVNFLVYFSKWIVLDGGLSDMSYNLVFVISAAALLLTGPALAAHTDKCNDRKLFLNLATIATIASYMAAALFAIFGAHILLAFFGLLAGQYFFQLAYIFFDPLLNDLADEKNRARASGFAQFASAAGLVFGLAIFLPLVESGGRLASLVPSVILFAILAAPLMIFYREKSCKAPIVKPEIKLGFDWKMFRNFLLTSAAAPVLIAFFFYTNALNTITNNYSIYAGAVLNMPDSTTAIILIVTQIAAMIGALLIGFFGDKFGIRRSLLAILWTWLLLIPLIAASSNMNLFFVLAGILGLTIGAGWAASRAYISTNLESGKVGYGFSFYTIFERFSAMVGPLAWGGVLLVGGGYRLAMLSMAGFI
ncbi:MAG: MFS transporter, partial [Alphaproteobacteria bacterium]|nr:MFS transporter [Alphaproteobacteria bacterium]